MAVTIVGDNTPTAGGVSYGTGANIAFTSAGTSGQILTSAGSGAPTWSALPSVNLTTGVTGTLPIANGGTNSTATPTAGGVGYGTGSAHAYTTAGSAGGVLYSAGSGAPAFSAAGTSGQVLTSAGSSAPTWSTLNGAPGAFGQFSVAGVNNTNNIFYAASPADMLSAGGFAGAVVPSYNQTPTNYLSPTSVFYSSYYGCWFCAGYESISTLQYGVYSSKNGLNWSLALMNFRGKAGASSTETVEKIAVDDSNGALVVTTFDNTNLQVGLYVSAGTNWSSFTRTAINYSGSGSVFDLLYIDTGTVGTSATVAIVSIDGTISLRTCSAGATSWTTRVASGVGGTLIQYNRASGFAFTVSSGSTATYFTNNNAQTGWTNNTSTGVTFNQVAFAASNGVMAATTTATADTLAYSTTGSGSWTSVTSFAGGNTVYTLIHNGSVWIALTAGGLYYNTNALPTGAWTRAAASGAIRLSSSNMRQRYI